MTRIVAVFECGAIVNPDGLHNQVEGSVVQGLGGALFETVKFADGRLLNGTMAQYRVPRFKDVPPIEIVLLDRPDLPSAGAGETPIVCVAPAIGSGGARLRRGQDRIASESAHGAGNTRRRSGHTPVTCSSLLNPLPSEAPAQSAASTEASADRWSSRARSRSG